MLVHSLREFAPCSILPFSVPSSIRPSVRAVPEAVIGDFIRWTLLLMITCARAGSMSGLLADARKGGLEMEERRWRGKKGRKTVYPFLRARNFHRKSACRATATAVAARAISTRSTRSAVGVGILRLILRTAAVAAVSGTEPRNAAAAADRICREEMCSRAADVA